MLRPVVGSPQAPFLQLVSFQSFGASERFFAVSADEFTQMRRVQMILQRFSAQKADCADFALEQLGLLWFVHDVEVSHYTLLGDKRGGTDVTGDQALCWVHAPGQSMDSLEVEIKIVGSLEANLFRADVAFVLDFAFLVQLPHVPVAVALVLEFLVTLIAREDGYPFMYLKQISHNLFERIGMTSHASRMCFQVPRIFGHKAAQQALEGRP